MHNVETRRMIADYMESGFLENILDLFRHDASLYALVPALMADERSRVRIGATALVDELKGLYPERTAALAAGLAPLLGHENPTIRADAAYLMEITGNPGAVRHLEAALGDESPAVREVVVEAIEALKGQK